MVDTEKRAREVREGRRLSPLVRDSRRGGIETRVGATGGREARRRIAIAALGGVTRGLLVGLGLQGLHVEPTATAAESTPVPAPAPSPAPEPAAVESQPAVAPVASAEDVAAPVAPAAPTEAAPAAAADGDRNDLNPDTATLDRYQAEMARALSHQPGIASGVWLTRQTLAINRTGELEAVWPRVCQEVLRYPALRNVRVQINARPGVDEPVRWRQCATY